MRRVVVFAAIFDTYQYQTEGEGVETWLREVEELLREPAAEGDAAALTAQMEQSDVRTPDPTGGRQTASNCLNTEYPNFFKLRLFFNTPTALQW